MRKRVTLALVVISLLSNSVFEVTAQAAATIQVSFVMTALGTGKDAGAGSQIRIKAVNRDDQQSATTDSEGVAKFSIKAEQYVLDSMCATCDQYHQGVEYLIVPSSVTEDISWVPPGYSLSEDLKVAYKWKSVDFCDPDICWKWSFISNVGCQSDLYAAINFLDASGAAIGYTNATLPSLRPMQTAILTFNETPDDGGKNAEISQIQCL